MDFLIVVANPPEHNLFQSGAWHVNLATHLLNKGEENLAQSILDEVAYIQQYQSFSEDGEKRLKYGTRSLLLPARIEES